MAFSRDGKTLASGSFDDGVKLWDLAAGVSTQTLDASGFVYGLAFSPDGKTLAAGSGKVVQLWALDR